MLYMVIEVWSFSAPLLCFVLVLTASARATFFSPIYELGVALCSEILLLCFFCPVYALTELYVVPVVMFFFLGVVKKTDRKSVV